MSDALLDTKKLSATYSKANEILTLRGTCEPTALVGSPRFVLRVLPTGGLVFDVRGVLATGKTVAAAEVAMIDLDIAVTMPSKTFSNNLVIFNTKNVPNLAVPILTAETKTAPVDDDPANQFKAPGPGGVQTGTKAPVTQPVQPTNPTSGDVRLGGQKGLPPPELNFAPWLDTAFKAAKVKFPGPDPILVLAKADKQPTPGVQGKYTLNFSAIFLLPGNKATFVDKDGNVGKAEIAPSNMPNPVKSLKPSKDLWEIVSTNITSVGAYTSVNYNSTFSGQPGYIFSQGEDTALGAFSATDGKKLEF